MATVARDFARCGRGAAASARLARARRGSGFQTRLLETLRTFIARLY